MSTKTYTIIEALLTKRMQSYKYHATKTTLLLGIGKKGLEGVKIPKYQVNIFRWRDYRSLLIFKYVII